MPIIEPVIRPPAEANSFLLQVTTGCSANTCTFCAAYKGKAFRVKSMVEIIRDIREYALHYPRTRKVFLMDGDALILNNNKLIPILDEINKAFPKLTRISSYANGDQIVRRTKEELDDLFQRKLSLFYIGLESGSQEILDDCHKRPTAEEMITGVIKAWESKIKSSVIVLLGVGGKEKSELHIKETIKAINKMQPRYLSFLSLMLVPGTEAHNKMKQGKFNEIGPKGFLVETYEMLKELKLDQTIFRSNHASNYLSLEGRLPQDKERLLLELHAGINDKVSLKPEFFRGL